MTTKAGLIAVVLLAAMAGVVSANHGHGYGNHGGGSHFSFGFYSAPPAYYVPPVVVAPAPV